MFEDQPEKIERAKRGLVRRESLLKGEMQAEGVRKFLRIGTSREYPRLEEFPSVFFVPPKVVSSMASISSQAKKDGKEREFYVGISKGKWWLSPTHVGDEREINNLNRDLFPKKRPEYVIMEVHTHFPLSAKADVLQLPSPRDIATLVVTNRDYSAMMVSAPSGVWLMIKGREYFQKQVAAGLEETRWNAVTNVVQEKIDELNRKPQLTILDCESYFARMLMKYGIAFYSSNPDYGFPGHDPRPVLNPKEEVEMARRYDLLI